MRLSLVLMTLFAAACSSTLPKAPAKSVVFALAAPEYANVTAVSEVWRDERRGRDVPVKIYAAGDARGRLPVVVFSHGIGESRDSYEWLGRALAQHGFVTVHVTHAGTDRAVLERGYLHLYRAVKQPENWINRPLDVTFVLDRLASRADADMTRVAAVGHSAGAFTALALAGLRTVDDKTFRDARVQVAIPMSMPRLGDVVPSNGYDAIDIPVLNMTGTRDTSLIYRTFPRHRRIPFEQSRGPRQYLVTVEGATHNSFVLEDARRDAIVALTVAFLCAHLRDDANARRWFDEAGRAEVANVAIYVERKTDAAR